MLNTDSRVWLVENPVAVQLLLWFFQYPGVQPSEPNASCRVHTTMLSMAPEPVTRSTAEVPNWNTTLPVMMGFADGLTTCTRASPCGVVEATWVPLTRSRIGFSPALSSTAVN